MNKYFIYTLSLIFTLNIRAMEKSPASGRDLIHAIIVANQKLALQLIKTHDINARDAEDMTALMHAARKGYKNLVKVLVASGATINAKDINGMTALMHAALMNNDKIIQMLIRGGADSNAQDPAGWTALIHAANHGRLEAVEALITTQTHIDVKDVDGMTALMRACNEGHREVVKALIKAGATVNARSNYGVSMLMWSAIKGYKGLVNTLIAAGVDIEDKNMDGHTAFMVAADWGQKEIAKVLIAAGARCYPVLRDYANYKAFATQIQELFACGRDLSRPCDVSSTHSKLKINLVRRINQLIKTHKLSLDYVDNQGNTLLHYAVLSGNRVAISLMLYLMIRHNQFYALEHRSRQSNMTPIEMAVTSRAAPLLHPFFNLLLPNKS